MSPLHHMGDIVRELLMQVPLGAARALFLVVPVLLLAWILTLPRDAVQAPGGKGGLAGNLRLWASVALLVQLVVYAFL